MARWRVFGVAAAVLLLATAAHAETLTNQSVVMLSKAGLGADAIVAKIQTSANTFDLSTDQLLELKREGVSDAVIAAMLRASTGSGVSANAAGD